MAAKHLIRWCLQGDPQKRPSLSAVLAHPFLDSITTSAEKLHQEVEELYREVEETPPSAISPHQPLDKVRSSAIGYARMAYHIFISHMQTEVQMHACIHACIDSLCVLCSRRPVMLGHSSSFSGS